MKAMFGCGQILLSGVILMTFYCSDSNSQEDVPVGCLGRIGLTFIVDQSESIRDDDPLNQEDYSWNLIKEFINGLVKRLPVSPDKTKIALIKYNETAELVWNLERYRTQQAVMSAVNSLQCEGGNTNSARALNSAYNNIILFDRSGARKIVIIFTDGMSTKSSAQETYEAVQRILLQGTEIYAIAIGKQLDEAGLKILVNQSFGKHLIHVQDYDFLSDIENLVAHRVCGLPDPKPRGPRCERKFDLTFIIDSSGSIKEQNFAQLKMFLVNLTTHLDVGPDRSRVAAIVFSSNATLVFRLGDYRDRTELAAKIRNIEFEDGHTNMSGALRVTVQEVYSQQQGDRRDVTNVAILVTDGASTLEQENTIAEAKRAKDAGIKIFVVGFTDKVNVDELEQIASKPTNEHYFDSTSVNYLNSILINLLKNICDDTG